MKPERNNPVQIEKDLNNLLFYSDFVFYKKDKDKMRKKLKKMIKKIDKGEIGDLLDQSMIEDEE